MDLLKHKLENNIEIFNTELPHVHLKKVEAIKTNGIYERLINWVSGEFDLYIKDESDILKVYFPNGWFSIRNFKDENNKEFIEIKVHGKSKIACEIFNNRILSIYNHVVQFYDFKSQSSYLTH